MFNSIKQTVCVGRNNLGIGNFYYTHVVEGVPFTVCVLNKRKVMTT